MKKNLTEGQWRKNVGLSGTPLQCSCLENSMGGGAWWAAVHGVAEGRTRLSDFTFTFHFHALEKEMATHSSVVAWRIPGVGEPDGLPPMGSHRVGHDWSNLAAAAAASDFRNKYFVRLKARDTVLSNILLLMMLFPKGVRDGSSDTIIYIYGNWTIKQIRGKMRESHFSLLLWEVTD